jgi:hypothetical protein
MFSNQDTKFDNFCQQVESNLKEAIQKYPEWRDEFVDGENKTLVQMDLNLKNLNLKKLKSKDENYRLCPLLTRCKNFNSIKESHEQISKLVTDDTKGWKADIICREEPKLFNFINTHTVNVRLEESINWSAILDGKHLEN